MRDIGFETTPRYFDRKGQPLQLLEYAKLLEDEAYRVVKQEEVGKYFVSTIWVGMNMCMWREEPKLIFETMMFIRDKEDKSDDPLHGYQDRYSTEEEAILGHDKAVKIAKGEVVYGEE